MNNFPNHYFLHLLEQIRTNTVAGLLAGAIAACTIPAALSQPSGAVRFYLCLVGAATSVTAKRMLGIKFELEDTVGDLKAVNRRQQIGWYSDVLNQAPPIPQMPMQSPTTSYLPASLVKGAISNFMSYWLMQGKHLLLVGGTNDGKSTLIKAIQYELQDWRLKAYDVDYAAGDYMEQVEVYYEYDQIAQEMMNDCEELEKRYDDRRIVGDSNWDAESTLIVAEELPSIVSEIPKEQAPWIRKLAKRGRKVRMFLACCVQNDTIENTGLKGDNALRDACFVRVYLGKFAVARAKTLGKMDLAEWLEETQHGRFLVDDRPCSWIIQTE